MSIEELNNVEKGQWDPGRSIPRMPRSLLPKRLSLVFIAKRKLEPAHEGFEKIFRDKGIPDNIEVAKITGEEAGDWGSKTPEPG